jgi:hypothetical protein
VVSRESTPPSGGAQREVFSPSALDDVECYLLTLPAWLFDPELLALIVEALEVYRKDVDAR